MNKCIVFFIVLVLVLAIAVITDNKGGDTVKNDLVEHKADTNRTLVGYKMKVSRGY